MPLNLYTNEPFNDQPFCEWEPGTPTTDEGEELIPDNGYGALAT